MSYDENDRREIAARLRSKRPEEFELRYERSVLEHIFHSLFPKQVYPVSNWVLRMPYTLADLIERQTCRKVIPSEMEGYVFCSNCGAEIGEYGVPNYCHNCGAKVINDD